jgi:hypothetical protein
VEGAVAVGGLHADRVDHRVGSPAAGQILQLLDDVGVLSKVHDVRGARLVHRHLETVVVLVDRDHPLRAEQDRARDRELADGARSEDRDHLAARDVAEVRAEVAGGEDVGEKQDLLVRELVLDLDRADVRVRHARVLGLSTGVSARDV